MVMVVFILSGTCTHACMHPEHIDTNACLHVEEASLLIFEW